MIARLTSRTAAVALTGVMLIASCKSPEGRRVRGGNERGADVGNRDAVVQMHAGSKMYYDTPCLLPDDECSRLPPVSGLPGDFPDTKRKRS